MTDDTQHISVLKEEVCATLAPAAGERILDVTLGQGGHAAALLKAAMPGGSLVGLDADSDNLRLAQEHLSFAGDDAMLLHANFGVLGELNLGMFDVIFADLGLSSMHVDNPERGFSFRFDGPLDLRFDRTRGKTAADLIHGNDEQHLAQIFRTYGELYMQAKKLGHMLAGTTVHTTTGLRMLVEEGFGFRAKNILPQVFQALRIAVNDELHVLEHLLAVAPQMLKEKGRMGIISFHSLEDRLVKHTFRSLAEHQKDPITGKISQRSPFQILTPKAMVPSTEEVARNPRARSAKFRAVCFDPSHV